MAHLVLVCGPPCSGKTTLVREHMKPGDVVIDHDAIAMAVGSPAEHDHPVNLTGFVWDATDALLRRARRDKETRCVWYIRCSPTRDDLAMADEILVAPTSMDDCLRRAVAAGRGPGTLNAIRAWVEP